jgi:hypothetical protein
MEVELIIALQEINKLKLKKTKQK